MVLSRHSLCAGLLLSALLCGAAPTQWSENLVKNGDFTRGSGSVAENWTPGFFDGAKGSVEWRPGSGPDSAAALNFAFTPPPKGLIQAESSLVRLPEQGNGLTIYNFDVALMRHGLLRRTPCGLSLLPCVEWIRNHRGRKRLTRVSLQIHVRVAHFLPFISYIFRNEKSNYYRSRNDGLCARIPRSGKRT